MTAGNGRARLLVVEDDPALGRFLVQELGAAGYKAVLEPTGGGALARAELEAFDLVVLDLQLPDVDGFEVARRLDGRAGAVLMLTARADLDSRLEGLYAGASDYMAKPFHIQELLARIHVRLRERAAEEEDLEADGVRLEPGTRLCRVHGEELELPEMEFELLRVLLAGRGRVFSREELERRLYGAERPASNVVEVYVHGLRRRLAGRGVESLIRTVRGKGYMVR